MNQIISFPDKSLYHRREEYKNIFEDGNITTDLEKLWSEYLETYVDPIGWQAVWKMKRITCETLKLMHPTVLRILVKYINFEALTAQVKVLNIEEALEYECKTLNTIEIGKEYCAPLLEIFPINTQEPSVILNLLKTAECLDAFRYFYNNLWFPRDIDCYNKADNWFHKNLEPRLKLSYEIYNGTIPSNVSKDIICITTTAKHLDAQRLKLESQIDDDTEFGEFRTNPLIKMLAKIDMKMDNLQTKFHILEQLHLRTAFYENANVDDPIESSTEKLDDVSCIVFSQGLPLKEQIKFMKQVNCSQYIDCNIRYVFENSIEDLTCFNAIMLCPGKHEIDETIVISNDNWKLEGISDSTTTISMNLSLVMFDLSGEKIIFNNIILDLCYAPIGVIIRKGCVTLNNCIIKGSIDSTTQRGIVLFPETKLVMNECKLTDISVAIVGKKYGDITLNNCQVENNKIGLNISDECFLNLNNSSISSSTLFGVCLESQEIYQNLQELPHANIINCKMENNGKQCGFYRRQQSTPQTDIFSETFFIPNIKKVEIDDGNIESDASEENFETSL